MRSNLSVGTSHLPHRAVLQDLTTWEGRSWIIDGQAVPDTLPVPAFATPYHVIESAPGVWMVTGPHEVQSYWPVANSDAAASAYTQSAIEEAIRAVAELRS